MNRDLILAAYDNYDWNQLRYLVNSIKKSGFSGDVCFVAFNSSFDTVEKLVSEGVMVVAMEKDDNARMYRHTSSMPIHTERFFHFFNILKDNAYKYRYVITVDAKDVIFQKNPSEWLENYLDRSKDLLASTECLKYKDEPWGNLNMEQAFGPYFHAYFKENLIYNVGVVAGTAEHMRDLCLNIFLLSTNRPYPIVDQAVFNALINSRAYQSVTQYAMMNDGWACHLGTVADPTKIDQFRPLLTEKEPKLNPFSSSSVFQNLLLTHDDKTFTVVHQWDRVPAIKTLIEEIYG